MVKQAKIAFQYLTDGLKNRIRYSLIVNCDLEDSFVFLWEFLQRYLSFRMLSLEMLGGKQNKGKKSLEDLAASVLPVIPKASCQTSKEWSLMIAKLQLFEPETVLDIQRKEN